MRTKESERLQNTLLRCSRYHEARIKLTDFEGNFRIIRTQKNVTAIRDFVVDTICDTVTKKEEKLIKEALFQFISDTKVKI